MQALPLRRDRPRLAQGYLAVKDEETEACATAFLREAAAAFPFKVVLTDRGSCFTADGFEAACRKLGIDHRKTKPYTPQTNGMVERFNGRIGREVLVMCIGTHDALERLLHGYNLAYNARRQRVLNGQSPDQVVQARLETKPELANPAYQTPSPCDRTKIKVAAQLTVYSAKDLSHPDSRATGSGSTGKPGEGAGANSRRNR